MIAWLEAHENLSGWAQFFGAMVALGVTYFTAFAPMWRRKRQLQGSAQRLLSHGYETIESYQRTSEYGDLFPVSLRQAALSMGMVAEDIGRFPIYELDDHGSNSLARRLVAMGVTLGSLRLAIETMAADLEVRDPAVDDRDNLRHLLSIALKNAEAFLVGRALARPNPPPAYNGFGEQRSAEAPST